jgi:hypothetical protein
MPMPTKFTAKRRELVIVALSAGASRRTAAEVAGVDHSTLVKWIGTGSRGAPGGMWRRLHDAVVAAEEGSHRPRLLPLRETPPAVLRNAWQIVERELDSDVAEPAPSLAVNLFFADGTPISRTLDPRPEKRPAPSPISGAWDSASSPIQPYPSRGHGAPLGIHPDLAI